jgi:nucleotide-binding universal stress UspA family protein
MSMYSVLISVALPTSGVELLRVARSLAPAEQLRIIAVHCRMEEPAETDCRAMPESPDPLLPLLKEAGSLSIDPILIDSPDVGDAVVSLAEERDVDLLLMGWHGPMTSDADPPGPVQTALERAPADVGVYLARQFRPWRQVLVPYFGGPHDRAALQLAGRIEQHTGIAVTVLHVVPPDDRDTRRTGLSNVMEDVALNGIRLKVVKHEEPVEAAVQEAWLGYDVIVVGASEVWGLGSSLFAERHQRLAFATPSSLLVVHHRVMEEASERSEGLRAAATST